MRDFHKPGRSPVFAINGACASPNPMASKVAVGILEVGGTAADAAVAAAAMLCLTDPSNTGIGGDCSAVIKSAGAEDVIMIGPTGEAPSAAEMFCTLSERWGRLGLDEVLAPAIKYCQTGLAVSPRAASDWQCGLAKLDSNLRKRIEAIVATPKAGQISQAPHLAEVLRQLAKNGRAGFYDGEIAEDLGLGSSEICLTEKSILSATYCNLELLERETEIHGPTALLVAKILDQFDMSGDYAPHPVRAHYEIEAAKLAFRALDGLASAENRSEKLAELLSEPHVRELANQIDPDHAKPGAPYFTTNAHDNAISITVVDRDLMAISLTCSLARPFGNGWILPKLGLLKRPDNLAGGTDFNGTMLKESGRVTTVLGLAGGPSQSMGHVRLLSNLTDYNQSLQEAIDTPRCYTNGEATFMEASYPRAVTVELGYMDHTTVIPDGPFGGAQAIRIDYENGVLEAASDTRQDGCALGY